VPLSGSDIPSSRLAVAPDAIPPTTATQSAALTNAAHRLLKLWAAHNRPRGDLDGPPPQRTTPPTISRADRQRLRGNAPRNDFSQRPRRKAAVPQSQWKALRYPAKRRSVAHSTGT